MDPIIISPSREFVSQSLVKSLEEYKKLHAESIHNPDQFLRRELQDLHFDVDYNKTFEWDCPNSKWFLGGKTNLAYNCLDRHIHRGIGDRTAIISLREDGDRQTWSYRDIWKLTCHVANGLTSMGVGQGDVILIYMPICIQSITSMLACVRIGAVHNVVFGGFSPESVYDRMFDCSPKVIITVNGSYRRGKAIYYKDTIDKALSLGDNSYVKHVLVFDYYTDILSEMDSSRDIKWSDLMENQSDKHEHVPLDSSANSFILYTSGSTGKPKGVHHSTAGYMAGAYLSTKYIFDVHPETDVYCCTADIGWITGHTYVTYGPLLLGMTQVIYDGAWDIPDQSRLYDVLEKTKATILYSAPTLLRAVKFSETKNPLQSKFDLSSLRLLGLVGEPVDKDSWNWLYENIGKKRCPIVDTFWQTETGSIVLTTLPGAMPMKPATAGRPYFMIDMHVVDDDGRICEVGEPGQIAISSPWPSMMTGFGGTHADLYKDSFSKQGRYLTGDGGILDEDGMITVCGRSNDIINVAGHRVGSAEVEGVVNNHPMISECAVVGIAHPIKGQGLVAVVKVKSGSGDVTPTMLTKTIRNFVRSKMGSLMIIETVVEVETLPKTRSGKVMRRLIREIIETGKVQGNVATLEDMSVIEKLQTKLQGVKLM